MRFLTGGYTADMGGAASGIGMLAVGGVHDVLAGGPLGFVGTVAACDSPSWIAWHPARDVVYAALEGTGQVRAFARTGDASFAPLGGPVDAGALACHVAVAPDGRSLVASCWGDGRVVSMPLDAAGRPGAPVLAAAAHDPHGDAVPGADGSAAGIDLVAAARALREAAGLEYAHLVPDYGAASSDGVSPDGDVADGGASAFAVSAVGAQRHGGAEDTAHVFDGDRHAGDAGENGEDAASDVGVRVSRAHQAVFLPGDTVLTVDMGFDLVRVWHRSGTALRPVQQVVLPRGVGPRHLLCHPSGHVYVVTELSQELFVLAADRAGVWRVVSGTRLHPAALADDAAAEIAASRDGAFIYVGVRGSNTVATLRVHGDGASLAPVALTDCGVDWPRHHVIARDTLLVAGQRSDDVVSMTLDERTGVPGRVRHRTAVPAPTCLLPLP